ncbi:MAG: hypothetical protein K8F27_01110 [Sulfuricellaceae bacterium]|nr:hypothetical protein [Sulfuricellaceae bacterium]
MDDQDVAALLPSRRQVLRDVLGIALLSAAGGLLLGYCYGTGAGVLLSSLTWGLSIAFFAAFAYAAWRIYRIWERHRLLLRERQMEAFHRAIEGESAEGGQ